MISISVHTTSPGHALEAEVKSRNNVHWVDLHSWTDRLVIHVDSQEHAQRIADACNWRQEPVPMPVSETPIPEEIELSPTDVVAISKGLEFESPDDDLPW